MRKLPVFLGVFSASVVFAIFAGCGSDGNDGITSPDGSADGANTDGSSSGSASSSSGSSGSSSGASSGGTDGGDITETDASANTAPVCKDKGATCASSADCCSANCAGTTCGDPQSTCSLPGVACTAPTDCCTGSCVNNVCADKICVPDKPTAGACAQGGDCCSGICISGKCASVNPTQTCRTSGNPCGGNSDCCSSFCNAGICSSATSPICTVLSDICANDADCCSGFCQKASGATTGVCASLPGANCAPAGELCSPSGTCTTGANCCSRSCGPSPTSGLGVCQQESGCHMIGDLCRDTTDCCGVLDQPGSYKTFNGGLDGGSNDPSTSVTCQKTGSSTIGVCTYVNTVCSAAGQLCKPGNATTGGAQACSTKIDCCSGNANQYPTCQIDENGIPRCTIQTNLDCTHPPSPGSTCASSADCCGAPCIKNPNGTSPAYICGTTSCQQQGNSCTSTADCCSGLPCAIPLGSSTGVCGGTLLPDGGVSTTPPPGTDGGVVTPPSDAGTSSSSSSGGTTTCALYGQACTVSGDCCSGVPCVNGTCHYP